MGLQWPAWFRIICSKPLKSSLYTQTGSQLQIDEVYIGWCTGSSVKVDWQTPGQTNRVLLVQSYQLAGDSPGDCGSVGDMLMHVLKILSTCTQSLLSKVVAVLHDCMIMRAKSGVACRTPAASCN